MGNPEEYRFEIKDTADSIKHQEHFFKLGYDWAGGHGPKYTEKKYLYLFPSSKRIMFSDRLSGDPNEVECKLLHPKQKDFLEQLVNKGDIAAIEPIVDDILSCGFYKVPDSDYLNYLKKHFQQWYQM